MEEKLDRFADAVLAIKDIVESFRRQSNSSSFHRSTEWTRFPPTETFACGKNSITSPLPFNRIKPSILNDLSIPEIKPEYGSCSSAG